MRNTLISHTANADQIVILQYEVHQVSGLYPVQYSQMSGVRTPAQGRMTFFGGR